MLALAKGGDSGFLITGLQKINAAVEDAIQEFAADAPERCAPALARGLKETISLLDQVTKSDLTEDSKYNLRHELQVKREQFNTTLAAALALAFRDGLHEAGSISNRDSVDVRRGCAGCECDQRTSDCASGRSRRTTTGTSEEARGQFTAGP